MLCELCGVSRSGYYKWKKRAGAVDEKRAHILKLVAACHQKHATHGYRWVHAYLARTEAIEVSADYIRKCFKYLGIRAKTRHRPYSKRKSERPGYPNLIFSCWDTVDRPRQVIVSDMTAFWAANHYYELVLYFDVFTKQILGYGLSAKRGSAYTYYKGLEQVQAAIEKSKLEAVGKLEPGSGELCVIHTDQGSVYTSLAYNQIIREAGLARSCSRPGKPTDNPVNESLNGWIKEEMMVDFGLRSVLPEEIDGFCAEYIGWYNAERPCYALGYRTPDEVYQQYLEGQIETRDTFAHRVLDPTPKFLRQKLSAAERSAESQTIGTSDGGVFM